MSTNVVVNPSFESGLAPWTASAPNVAKIYNGTSFYGSPVDGNYFVSVQTAIDNQANSISQTLTGLKTTTNYTLSVSVKFPEYSAEYCMLTASLGRHMSNGTSYATIAQVMQSEQEMGNWTTLTGSVRPKSSTGSLRILAYCDEADNSATDSFAVDAVSFAPSEV